MVQKPSRTQRRVARRIKTKRRRRRNPKRMEGEWCTEKLVLVVLRLLEKLCKWGISMFIPLSLSTNTSGSDSDEKKKKEKKVCSVIAVRTSIASHRAFLICLSW
jgi:hypothetical protein